MTPELARLRKRARIRLRVFPCALLAIAEGLLRSWPLLILGSMPALALTLGGQGRQALLLMANSTGMSNWNLAMLNAVLVLIYATVVLDAATLSVRPRRAQSYARQSIPQLIGVSAAFALPLLVRYTTKLETDPTLTPFGPSGLKISVGFAMQVAEFGGPVVILGFQALMVAGGRDDFYAPEVAVAILIGVVHSITFVVTSDQAVLTRFVVLCGTIILANWFWPRGYLRTPRVRHMSAGAMSLIGLVSAIGVVTVVAVIALDPVRRAIWWGPNFEAARAIDGRAFRFSTATLLSARFPALSPVALYKDAAGNQMRLVDGGYADNSGTATAADMLAAVMGAVERKHGQDRFRPVVIAISNSKEPDPTGETTGGVRGSTLGALIDPVDTLDNVRAGVSKEHEAAIRSRVVSAGGVFLGRFHLRHGGSDLPLGWMLSSDTADVIDDRLKEMKSDPKSDFNRVGELLGRSASPR